MMLEWISLEEMKHECRNLTFYFLLLILLLLFKTWFTKTLGNTFSPVTSYVHSNVPSKSLTFIENTNIKHAVSTFSLKKVKKGKTEEMSIGFSPDLF